MDFFWEFFCTADPKDRESDLCRKQNQETGKHTVNSVPFPFSEQKEMLPPCAFVILSQIASPRPVPSCLCVTKGVNKSFLYSSGIPAPLSRMAIRI